MITLLAMLCSFRQRDGRLAEQALEELHGSGDDDRRIPVLHRQLQLLPGLSRADTIFVERAVVLDHEVEFFRTVIPGAPCGTPPPSAR